MSNDFRERMCELINKLSKNNFYSGNTPKCIYQYTNIDGLKGILETKKWRATHYQYLNDGKEITYGDELLSSILFGRLSNMQSTDHLRQIYEELLGIKYNKKSILSAWDDDLYLTSFSRKGDLLDQWRAYGSDGNGYSIGINPRKLLLRPSENAFLFSRDEEFGFVKVIYDQKQQESIFSHLINSFEKVIRDIENSYQINLDNSFVRIAAKTLSEIIWQLTLFYKHSAFKNEQEWRVVKNKWGRNVLNGVNQDALQGVKFRTSNNQLVPYLELDFSSNENRNILPIEKIILGPKHDQRSLNSLKMYLESLGYAEHIPELKISEIPYR